MISRKYSDASLNKNISNFDDRIVNETLALKFSNQDKIFKIPLKFYPKIPKIEINKNSF